MDTRGKSDTEFRNEVNEILARHELNFDQIHNILQTILLADLQALKAHKAQPNVPATGDVNPFAVDDAFQPTKKPRTLTEVGLVVGVGGEILGVVALAIRAAQTLNPIATNAATTFSLLRSLGQPPAQPPDSHQPPAQPLRNQTATNPASCAASVQPLRNQTATATNPASCAAHLRSHQTATSLLRSPTQSESHQHSLCPCSPAPIPCSPVPCTALCSLVQPSPAPIREIQPRLVLCSPYQPSPVPVPCSPAVIVMADSLKEVVPAHMVPVPSPVPVSLSHSQPAQRVTSVLLNGKNFYAWSRSFQLYLGGKRKTRWILGKEPKPAESDPKFDEWVSDNCIILGWMFNSMEDRVYHMFVYHDTVHGLWTALTQIWEELAQYEPLSDFPSDGAVESKRLDRRHTYQFLMGLKSEFETLRTQILNTSPLPSLYEAFAIVDGDERRRRILPSLSLPESSSIVPDQRAFAAASGTHLYCQHCRKPGHLIDRCWVLHPELKQQFFRPRGGGRGGGRSGGRGRGTPRTGTVAEVDSMPSNLPDFKQLQLQIAQLQSHLGLATASQSSGPTAAIVAETLTALHGKSGHPTWILDSGANNHMTGELATFTSPVTSIHQSVCIADGSSIPIRSQGDACLSSDDLTSKKIFGKGYERDGLYYFGDPLPSNEPIPPRPLPILEPTSPTPTPNGSLSPIASQDPGPPRSGSLASIFSGVRYPHRQLIPDNHREGWRETDPRQQPQPLPVPPQPIPQLDSQCEVNV
ncbi:hypothetical protein Acr_01g0008960 [Actinidia rufa]|uniref:Retrotransposon Copia-like N-terminal domain-containing protein n=1 Tax=Actinidia rufa TaxID=165716 RepID=A0A7J0E5Y9_9ERIC|nr:hypothetical protein Acr_01g0008960 [Actinidia rufa]